MIWRLLTCLVAGAVMSLAYQPVGWWWTALPALAAVILSCHDQSALRGLGCGLAFGVPWCLSSLTWLRTVIGPDAWIILSLYTALWIGLAGAATALVSRQRLAWLWIPCIWVLVEAISGRVPFGGWGWLRIGFTQDDSWFLPWAGIAGVPGLTFLVMLLAAVLAEVGRALFRWRQAGQRPTKTLLLPAAVAVGVAGFAVIVPVASAPQDDGGPATRQVGLVQGNVAEAGIEFNARRREVLDNHVEETLGLSADVSAGKEAQPDLVLWPENASDIDPYRNQDANQLIDDAAAAVGAPILVGAVVEDQHDDSKVLNQGIVWDPVTGPGQTYTKRNLVPFGEYVPFRGLLARYISRFDEIPRDFAPGDVAGVLDIGGTRIGDAICFDVAYDDALRSATQQGARMLVVQTNNATYNGTRQPFQQFAMSRIRAVEHGRVVAVVSTSGISGVITPDGSVVPGSQLGELVAGRYVLDLAQRDALTVSDRVGSAPEWAIGGIGLLALLAASGVRPRRRHYADRHLEADPVNLRS